MTVNQLLQKKLISIAEALEMMGIGRTTFYEEAKKGKITLKKFGKRKTLVLLASVEEWIESLPTVGGEHAE